MKIWGKKMNKKLMFGSLLVLTLLLLMPSIPAIQQNIIEEKSYNDSIEQLEYEDITDLIQSGKLDNITHPLLYLIIKATVTFRFIRFQILYQYSCDGSLNVPNTIVVYHWVLFMRSLMILFTTMGWLNLWNGLSEKYGWNWDIPEW